MTQLPSNPSAHNSTHSLPVPPDLELLDSAVLDEQILDSADNRPSPLPYEDSSASEPNSAAAAPQMPEVVLPQSRKLQVRFKNSIASRLFLYVLGGTLVGLGGMSIFFYQKIQRQVETEIQGQLSTQAKAVEAQLARAEESVQSLATTVQTLRQQEVDDPEIYRNLAFEFFKQRPELAMGVGFGQAPSKIVASRQWFYPYFYVDQNVPGQIGQVLPAPNQTVRYAELFETDNYPQQDYYKIIAESKKPQWYEPYQWYGITITTHGRPILAGNEFLGLATLDVNVTAIGEQINTPVLRDQGFFAIVSEQGNLLAYPPDPQKARELATVEDVPQLREVWEKLGQTEQGVLRTGGTFWAYERIPGTNWLMLASVPGSVIDGPALSIVLGGALSAGLLLALVVLAFSRQLNQRLQPLLDECNTLADADAQRAMRLGLADPTSTLWQDSLHSEADELEIVTQSFQRVTSQLRDTFTALEASNKELEQRVEERTAELREAKEASEQDKQLLQRRALELLREVDPISKGDLTVRAKVTPDEIGTLADSYNATVASLRKIVTQVQQATSQVTETTRSNEAYIQALSAEAARQANEIADALEQIQSMARVVRVVADNAEQAEAVVQQAAQTVQEGEAAMNRTVDGIQAIRSTVAETAKKVKHLGESSQKISTVVELISAFASQTNMLALNASIEATRAGEAGRGFAVVASEVRALAQRSAEATEEIRKLVASIQAETNEVVVAMEAGTEQVVIGTKLVDETRQSLNKITTASAKISELVEAIAQATVIQSQSAESVAQTMKDVATVASKTSEGANQVNSSFEQLQQVAETLQASVDRFKVS
ncbi:MAG: hypothetical protein IGS38_09060 [Synechococcales cyanobacterium M58_A2018_015]|nr:hypothetical protein [Synechococcales cyanobacterium M58_A2018_015]